MKNTDVNDNDMKNINRKLIYEFSLNGEKLPLSEIMDNPTITYDCGLEQYSVGNVYIGELQLTIKNTVFVNYNSSITITVKIEESSYPTYLGTFYVYSVEEQGSTKQIKAYDKMFKLNVGYFPSAKHTSTKAIMDDIRQQYDLNFASPNFYSWEYGNLPINNEQLEGKTVLEVLSLVAGVHGGSLFFSGYFLTLTQPTLKTPKVTFTESEYTTPTLDDTTTYNITKLRVIYGEKTTDDNGNVTDEGYYEVGSGNDVHTLAISNPFLKGKQAQAKTILNQIKLLNGYKRFDTELPLGDYRLEPMDVIAYVKGDTTYKVPIIYMQFGLTHNGLIVRTQSPTLAESKKEFSFKGTITQKIDNVYTDMMQVKEIVANVITVSDLNAINAKIENLEATDATITNLVADKASINDLKATNANIENLKAKDAEIENLVANKADIEDLNATNANIGNLNADIATINTLLAGNITSENIQSGSITSDRLVIDDGFVKDAMIDTISANKIMSGRIDTGAITIGSEDGKMIIADETIQISDGTNVRVQIGETANGDYALVIWDENGEVMFDATGITESAIKDAIIKDDMISDTANINAQKIDINSLFTAINEDGSHTLNSSKIFLDTQQQTLNVAFNNMTTKQGELEEQTNVLSTELNVQSGKIETLIQNTTVTEDGKTINLKDKVSSIEQDLDGITLQVGTVESNITNITDDVANLEQRVASAELKVTEDAIVSTVTNSQVFKDAVATSADIGSRNYILNSDFAKGTDKWTVDGVTAEKDYTGMRLTRNSSFNAYYGIEQTLTGIEKVSSNKWTLSCWYYLLDEPVINKYIKLSIKDKYGDDIIKNIVVNPVYGKWTRIVCTGETTKTPKTIAFGASFNCSIYVSKFKLENGGVATDWSPNPSDFDNELNGALTRIETSETKIEQNAQAIALRATKEEVETINGQVTENTTKIGELQISTDSISATVSENINNINANAEKISKLEMQSDSITMEVQSSIGVDNLLINSAFYKGDYGWTLSEYETEYSYEGIFIHSGDEERQRHPFLNVKWSAHSKDEPDAKLGAKQQLKVSSDKLSTGEKFSFSCKYYLPSVGNFGRGFAIELVGNRWISKFEDETLPPEGIYVDEVVGVIDMSNSNFEDVVVGKWTTVSKTVTLNHNYRYLYIYPYLKLQGEIEFTDFMAIVGNKLPSDWIASPIDAKEDINSLEEQIIVNTQTISTLQINADNINASVQRVETTMNNSFNDMNNNLETLTNRVDATMTAEDIKFEISKELQNGTGKVTTSTGFTFNEDGLTVSKSDSEMSTQITENGMKIYKNDTEVLSANNKGVNATNLHATTYLIVGNNSRFEDYGNGRTGCFYIYQAPDLSSTSEVSEASLLSDEEEEWSGF